MSCAGLLTSLEVEGAIDGDAFFVFLLQNCLAPCLRPGDVVLMTTCPPQKQSDGGGHPSPRG